MKFRHSILFLITLSFVFSIILVIVGFFMLSKNIRLQQYKQIDAKLTNIHYRRFMLNEKHIKSLGYEIVLKGNNILQNGKILYIKQTRMKTIKYLKYKNKFYIYFKSPLGETLMVDKHYPWYDTTILYTIMTIMIFLLLLLYLIVVQKLKPLKKLQRYIKNLALEEFDMEFDTNGLDEISILSKELVTSATKLKKIKLSRDIFIKNIMHELKTPITKGKLLIELPQNPKNKELLQKVFYRLQNLISEFSQIEKFLSLDETSTREEYILDELIDSAIDISFIQEEQIDKKYDNIKLSVDFKIFTIALKNLIDNGVKYSSDKKLVIKSTKETINFINKGDKLAYPLQNYFEPFYNTKDDRFSVGFYIIKHILDYHNFELSYQYIDGQNIFSISYTKLK